MDYVVFGGGVLCGVWGLAIVLTAMEIYRKQPKR